MAISSAQEQEEPKVICFKHKETSEAHPCYHVPNWHKFQSAWLKVMQDINRESLISKSWRKQSTRHICVASMAPIVLVIELRAQVSCVILDRI